MNVKEKLVELLGNLFCGDYGIDGCDSCKYNTEVMCSAHACADRLIANGVTVQELDGCGFCQKFDFAGARAEVNKYGAHISLAICNTKFPDEERFKFCPMCGRRLPQPPKGE